MVGTTGMSSRALYAQHPVSLRILSSLPGSHLRFFSPGKFVTLQCTVFDTLQPKSMHLAGIYIFFVFFFISLIADGPQITILPVVTKDLPIPPQFTPYDFLALLQLVNQWLNFTYSRSHAFRYERKNTNPTLARIELTSSALLEGGRVAY